METTTISHAAGAAYWSLPGAGLEPRLQRPDTQSVALEQAPASYYASELASGYSRLRSRQDGLNELALSIRAGGGQVDMHKLFPPYPPEQEADMAYLDQMGGRLLRSLMLPAALDGLAQANDWAEALSRHSGRQLAAAASNTLSAHRSLLEQVAIIDPIQ